MNIFIGNLSFDATEGDLRQAFDAHGLVSSIKIITDRETGEPRGFGFVEMPSDDEARKAIEAIHETDIAGRAVNVNEARPRQDRGGGGGGGGGRSW